MRKPGKPTSPTRHFVIAGAQRSGTTLLAELLDQHPGIVMARPLRPEPKYFLAPGSVERGLAAYQRLFPPQALAGSLCGEKSTSYLEVGEVAARVRTVLPEARILFCLRDPVQRALSNHRFSVANGFETAAPWVALRRELDGALPPPPAGMAVSPLAYLRRGRYAELLVPWEQAFERERIRLVLYEELIAAGGPSTDTLSFLGVEPGFRLRATPPPRTVPMPPVLDDRGRQLEALLSDHFAAATRRLAEHWGVDVAAWPSAGEPAGRAAAGAPCRRAMPA